MWLGNILHGNLGISFISQTTVASVIRSALPIDLEIIVASQIMAFAAAIPIAMRSARKPDGILDRILGRREFHAAFDPSLHLDRAPGLPGLDQVGPLGDRPVGLRVRRTVAHEPRELLLPAITLAMGSFVVYYRVLRSDLIATLQEEFITMARSKGLSQRRIMWRHAFRPSSVALLGAASVNIGGLIAAGFIVQYLLAIPGLGYTLILAINSSDFLVVQGIILTVSVLVVAINFLFDFIINMVDPRISRE